ncbi:MAG: hypothetical protein LBE75_04175 [Burkholderiales bacterium]|jgi:riboflavin transporter FmnP|nr:hypothetical protein [Burkholderiales bacterium]
MSQEILDRMLRPEVCVFLFLFATLFLIIMIKALLYDPRAILAVIFVTGLLGFLRRGYKTAAMVGFAIEGAAVVGWMLYYAYRNRQSRMLRWLGGAMLASGALAALLMLR